ncbi:hypothetical protein MY1884_009706, partial [Beauveria asiatica]
STPGSAAGAGRADSLTAAPESINLTADDPDDPYVPGTARPRAYQRFTGAVKPEDIGLEAIKEGAEPADLRSPASEAASGSAFTASKAASSNAFTGAKGL